MNPPSKITLRCMVPQGACRTILHLQPETSLGTLGAPGRPSPNPKWQRDLGHAFAGGGHGSELPLLSLRWAEQPRALCLKQVLVSVWCGPRAACPGRYLSRQSIHGQITVPLWGSENTVISILGGNGSLRCPSIGGAIERSWGSTGRIW